MAINSQNICDSLQTRYSLEQKRTPLQIRFTVNGKRYKPSWQANLPTARSSDPRLQLYERQNSPLA